jgi:hypothetical protein
MAFNPFHRFRKHQKVFFAALTIVCMFVFVLQFGAGDAIQRMLAWFGSDRGRGALVTELRTKVRYANRDYGKKVYETDLEEVRARRNLANHFMVVAAMEGQAAFMGSLMKRVQDDKDNAIPPNIKDIVQRFQQRQLFAQFGIRSAESYQDVKRDLVLLRNLASLPQTDRNPEEARTIDSLAVALGFQAWGLSPEAGDFYFGGSRNKPDDLLDFLIWAHEADKLGITLTEADVRKEVVRAASDRDVFGGRPFSDSLLVQQYVGGGGNARGWRPADLLAALTDELRASMAQEALLGQPSGGRAWRDVFGVNTSPAVATPDEFLNYYRSVRTTLKVALLPVAVEKFVPKVTGSPSEQELVNLYEKYKDQEPAPDRVEPGFKEPRKVRVQYLVGSTDDEFYKSEAKKQAQLLGTFSDPQRVALLSVTAPGHAFAPAGPAALATHLGFPLAFDPVRREYESYLSQEQFHVDFRKVGVGFDLQDRSALPVAALGQAVAAGLSRTGPVAVPFANGVTIRLHERATVQAFAASVLGGATNSPWTALALAFPSLHTKQPFDVVKPQLLEKFEANLAGALLRDNLDAVKKELAKLKNRPEAEVKQYLEKAAKDYHLRLHSTNELRTQYTLAADPGLKVLKDAYAKLVGSTYKDANFVAMLLGGNKGAYDPRDLPADKETFLFWRSEDVGAKVRPFEAVRGQVEEVWRFRQARALALREAERINAKLKGKSEAEALQILRDEKLGDLIELDNVAQLVEPERQALITPTPVYQPYQPPEDKIAYPRPDFVKELLALTKPGESKVLRDRPVVHFYVAVLRDRSVPGLEQFVKVAQRSGDENPIWGDLMAEQRSNYRRMLLTQLRTEVAGANNLDAEGKIKIPEDVRVRNTESRE